MRPFRLLLALCLVACTSSAPSRPQDPEDERFLSDPGTGKEDSINFIEDGSYDAEAVLRFVNVADFLDLFDGAGLSQDTAEAIADATKPISTLAELDDIRFVGIIAFHKLREYALAHEYGPGLGEEYPLPGEDAANANVLDIIKQHVARAYPDGTRPVRRAQHAKAHGCVKAVVDIENGDLPSELRRGLFAEETQYQAWIRFSNGDFAVKPDGDKDVRGMAIKVMNVPGKRVAADAQGTSQDILLINGPQMFVRNALEYADFTRRAHEGGGLSLVGYFLSLNPADWKLRGLENLLTTISKSVRNPLESQYWSTTPYALGGTAMKWSAKPCGGSYAAPGDSAPDNLRAALRASVAAGDACFDLMVQVQNDARAEPIEDPTVPWAESRSPFLHVARITIPQQEFDSDEQEAFCERMIMSPWHSLEEHQPLGGINRARLPVYRAMAGLRNMMNGAAASEPTTWELQ
jgi:hypothetical protein